MELLEGQPLSEKLEGKPLSPSEALECLFEGDDAFQKALLSACEGTY